MKIEANIDKIKILTHEITEPVTATTTDLGIWLNGKIGFVFGMIWQIRKLGLI